MTPSLFIVVPTLNSYALLPRLLDSLQQQSYPHWRVLFVDGASGPKHRQWLEQCCAYEARCRWVEQDPEESGIFGAMNQGFVAAGTADWLLFWGSDDWTASPTVFADLIAALERTASQGLIPDLLVCGGRYVDAASGALARSTAFHPPGLLNTFQHFDYVEVASRNPALTSSDRLQTAKEDQIRPRRPPKPGQKPENAKRKKLKISPKALGCFGWPRPLIRGRRAKSWPR